ncbi:uncharacterized protein CTRU02_202738 [Colletotrichum truncatum]|uniref:Uncharacterized protein n=1 Tax=Colletotrichum truncatum TaxID=5467 RepID=A0ACC3ZL79_COLTU|nr:uncharacterized protein CTRU02_10662 [Colletotrichum truncatum]KAF6786963.1 hypothetical protein CTRU02_10662 [Colletotrichum truncatum]
MRKIIVIAVALAAYINAALIPTSVSGSLPAPTDLSREVTFTASNGSDVVFNVGTGFGIVNDLRNAPSHLAKHIKIVPVDGFAELCTVRATRRAGSGMPRRDDCQALHDYLKNYGALIYFEDHDADLARWAEIFWVGTCAFRTQTYSRNLVYSSADITRFLERSLSRDTWTVDGRMSASGEADCAVVDGGVGQAAMFWRLQERAAPQTSAAHNAIEAREPKAIPPLVVDTLEMVPRDTSAYVLNSTIQNFNDSGLLVNQTVAKRFIIDTDGDMTGPYCDPIWLSSSWDELNVPRRSDCEQLFEFVKSNKASVEFKDRDLDFWAKFAAHGTCGVMFKTTKAKMTVTNRDMAGFLDKALRWESTNTADGGTKAKMGVKCSIGGSQEKWVGEFRLFWRNPSLPIGQLDRRELETLPRLTADSPEPITPADDDEGIHWIDYEATTQDGKNVTFQVNAKGLSTSPTKLASRVEYVKTPLGPSKRCNSNTLWMGGAHRDSATVEDCKHLRDFIGAQRMYWQFSEEEVRNGRRDPVQVTPIAKYETCHFGYGPRQFVNIGNMDIERLLDGAIEYLDNTHGRMRGWGYLGCDFEEQFGSKADGYWRIYP